MSFIQGFGSGFRIADFVLIIKDKVVDPVFLGSGSGFGNKVSSGYGIQNMVGL